MLTLTFERVESNCILRLWREIMRQSQTGPLESSFCLVVLTRKKKKSHSRPTIYAVTITGPNVQLRFLYFGFLMGGRAHSKQILSIYGISINFSFQVIRRQPSLGCSYFIFGVLCKLKGILAWIRQPNANNPHLEETVLCYPSKHKHPLVTHSKQKWPMRPETSPGRQKRKHAAFKISFFIITDLLHITWKPQLNLVWENVTGVGH